MRTCTKCFTPKPETEFYAGSYACKVCICDRVKANREAKREQYAEYERQRFQDPTRKAKVAEYQRQRRERSPEKDEARRAVSWAVRRGWLKPEPCEVCGDPKVEAHHDDYGKPLQVRWLCFKHHREKAHGQVVTAA